MFEILGSIRKNYMSYHQNNNPVTISRLNSDAAIMNELYPSSLISVYLFVDRYHFTSKIRRKLAGKNEGTHTRKILIAYFCIFIYIYYISTYILSRWFILNIHIRIYDICLYIYIWSHQLSYWFIFSRWYLSNWLQLEKLRIFNGNILWKMDLIYRKYAEWWLSRYHASRSLGEKLYFPLQRQIMNGAIDARIYNSLTK